MNQNSQNSTKKRLLYFSSASSGGLADYAHEHAQALGRAGVNVTLLTTQNFRKKLSPLYNLRAELIANDLSEAVPSWIRKYTKARTILASYSLLAQIVQQEKFQKVLLGSFAEYLSPFWYRSLKLLANQGIKFGSVIHDPVRDYMVGPKWWHHLSIACAYSCLQEAFVHEPIELNTIRSFPNLQVTVIPHGAYEFAPASRSRTQMLNELDIPQTAKVLLSFGHIRDNKNLDLVLKAMAHFPNLYLIVAGQAVSLNQQSATYYQNLATSLGISERCRWLNRFIPEEEVGNLFTTCDLILLTYNTSFRSASGVLNAAVHYQKPCIASSGQSNLQTVVKQYDLGLFVKPDSVEAIIEGLQQWLNGFPPPQWNRYNTNNSWDKNAEIVVNRFWQV